MATTRTTEELDARAETLYEQEVGWRGFAQEFTTEELTRLADLCTMTFIDGVLDGGRSYDDEVFDALAITAPSS
ncbi:hypothetical protein SEA_MAGRITTE_158 [Microbacterium phage Magritte]|nr:hypothetical protein SEA_MAGRITTE_158 [Microbacterium phage Magritte]